MGSGRQIHVACSFVWSIFLCRKVVLLFVLCSRQHDILWEIQSVFVDSHDSQPSSYKTKNQKQGSGEE